MQTEQFLGIFTGTAGAIVLIIGLLWAVMSFLLPFMVYSIMQSNKQLISINRRILAELQRGNSASQAKQSEPEI